MTDTPTAPDASLPELPITAWRDGAEYWSAEDDDATPNAVALTPHAPAQAALAELRAEIERLTRERDEAVTQAKEIRARWNDAENEFAALKAAQPDVEALMKLADAYADRYYRWIDRATPETQYDRVAAREALRTALETRKEEL